MKPTDLATTVAANVPHGSSWFSLRMPAPEIARAVVAGQFVMVGIEAGLRPYLRRAFSVADVAGDEVEILVKTVGVGTAALEAAPVGARVSLLGPLGKGFDLSSPSFGAVVLVAGGVGVAPMILAARALAAAQVPTRVYFGGRSAAELVGAERLSSILGAENVVLATDDGSRGRAGRVTGVLAADLDAGFAAGRVLACGPEPMFAALEKVVRSRGIPSQFAMEREMACGFGVCLGCVVPTVDGRYATLCKEGPCVDPSTVDWARMHP